MSFKHEMFGLFAGAFLGGPGRAVGITFDWVRELACVIHPLTFTAEFKAGRAWCREEIKK